MKNDPQFGNWQAGGSHTGRQLAQAGSGDYRYTIGYVATADGVVGVYMEDGHTSLVVVSGGREIRCWWKRRFQERALITLCKRFAADVVAGVIS